VRTTQGKGASSLATRARHILLRFPDAELERHFLLSYRAAARPRIRMSLLLVLLAAFYFYFMLGLTFNAALRTNGALMRRTRSPRSAARSPLYATKMHGRDGWAFNGLENDAPVTATQAAALLKTAS